MHVFCFSTPKCGGIKKKKRVLYKAMIFSVKCVHSAMQIFACASGNETSEISFFQFAFNPELMKHVDVLLNFILP